MSNDRLYNIALFGAGRIGKIHARSIAEHPRTRLKYVIDPVAAAGQELAAAHGAQVATEAVALGDPDVAAILIASATDTHAALIEKGLKAGKAVFCEKPVDLSLARVTACLDAVKDCKSPLFVAFNRRFDPGIAEMRKRIEAGEIGAVELVTIVSKDPGPPPPAYLKVSGGLFRDMTIHDFDMARFIMGEEFITVTATASTLVDASIAAEGDIDTASVTLQTKSGRIAVITNSRRASLGYDQRVEAHGSKGLLRTENIPPTMLVQEDATGVKRDKPLFFFLERYAQSYRNEWDHFVRILAGETAASPSGVDGRLALAIAEAAYQSLQSGRRVDL